MVNNLETIEMIDKLIKELYELNIICRKEKVEAFLELIKIHKESCDKCSLKDGVRKLEW